MLKFSPMLILASTSPRRQMLFSLQGWEFEVHPARVNEEFSPGESPVDYVIRLASEKALSVSRLVQPDIVVIGADTAVVDGDDILGKPADPANAEAMLLKLRGRSHDVYTGLAVRYAEGEPLLTDWCVTQVDMRNYTRAELQSYVESGDPLDKAGAYAIQHTRFNPVSRIVGCYANVVGLPLCRLTEILRNLGYSPVKDLTRTCITPIGYDCQLAETILKNS